jgi:hypothetical protein
VAINPLIFSNKLLVTPKSVHLKSINMQVIFAVFTLIALLFFTFTTAEARSVIPFLFELPSQADLYYTAESLENGGPPESILQRSSEVTLPIVVKSSSEENIHLKFHATYGEQMASPKLPPGIIAYVEPNDIIIEKGGNTTINLIVKTAPDAPDGWYFMNIVGVMDSDDFSGTNISLKVGKGSEIPLLPSEITLSPLQQLRNGVAATQIQCKDGLQLVFKASNGNPACVNEISISKLIERGWAKPINSSQN